MKPVRNCSIIAAALGISLFGFRLPPAKAVGPFHKVNDCIIYYGNQTPQTLSQLNRKDLVIIEPQTVTNEQVEFVRSSGTVVIGYLSVMESPGWNKWRMDKLMPDYYLLDKGSRIYFAEWDSYLMDLRNPDYRELLLSEIQVSIADKGFNGIFLDTVGDIDDYIKDKATQLQVKLAYRGFLQEAAKRYPKLLVIQNRGFDTLDYAVPYIHGFLWEDWQAGWKQNPWMKIRVERLQKEQKKGLRVFSVTSVKDKAPGQEARRLNYIHMDIPDGYNTLPQ